MKIITEAYDYETFKDSRGQIVSIHIDDLYKKLVLYKGLKVEALPELLEALQLVINYHNRVEQEGKSYELNMRKCEAYGAAKQAIAKARGE